MDIYKCPNLIFKKEFQKRKKTCFLENMFFLGFNCMAAYLHVAFGDIIVGGCIRVFNKKLKKSQNFGKNMKKRRKK